MYKEQDVHPAQRAVAKPVLESFADMARPGDWKLNIGAPGSGVPNLVKRLLEANRVDTGALTLVHAFRHGKAIVVSPMVNAGAPLLTAGWGLLSGRRVLPHGPAMCLATGAAAAMSLLGQ